MKELWNSLTQSIEEAQVHLEKAEAGNKAAALRLRKSIKEMQSTLKSLRVASLKQGEENE